MTSSSTSATLSTATRTVQHEPGLQRPRRARHHEHPVPQLPCREVRLRTSRRPGRHGRGTNQSRSEWITGFDFHEWQDLVNCEVVNCVAEDNWESGFHLEPGARYGSRREHRAADHLEEHRLPELRQREQRPAEHLRGPLLHVRLLSLAGHPPRELQSRSTTGTAGITSTAGRQLLSRVHGYGSTYGWKICKASSDITLTDCISGTTAAGRSGSRSPGGSTWRTSST
jgi:hypothetical protein